MPYSYLEDIATADVAFEAWGETVEEMLIAAADATMNVMVADLNTIASQECRRICLEDESMEMLLFQLLQELIYYKDAQQLLLRIKDVEIENKNDQILLRAQGWGELIDSGKHDLTVDVKAVTLHQFRVEQTEKGWRARVILDI
jgi:SHS2 domain-containing protein